MDPEHDNVRPFVYRQVTHVHVRRGLAAVIPLHPGARRPRPRHAALFLLLAIGAFVALLAVLLVLVSPGEAVLGRLVPGWPWW
jgi:hypothetical protein